MSARRFKRKKRKEGSKKEGKEGRKYRGQEEDANQREKEAGLEEKMREEAAVIDQVIE